MTTDELAYMSAAAIADHVRRRLLSPVEIVDACIARIERRNPSLNAFVFKGFEDARKAARAAEQAVMSGAATGPLHGVPSAIKDLFDFKPGWPFTFGGVRAMKDCVADWHCVFAERVEKAGAILLGKTNSPTMGLRGTCDNYLFGPTRNPFDTRKNSGGSSGGSAAAVADGLVPFAEGTDAGGSIRIPAAWCNVVGFKASFGRVPVVMRPNAFGGIAPFVFEGPISRSVEDAALVLSVLSGYDAKDPFSIEGTEDFLAATRRSIKGWKIAYTPDFGVFPVEPQIRAVVEEGLRVFADAGAAVEHVELGLRRTQRELSDAWTRLMMPLNIAALEGMKGFGIDLMGEHRADFPPDYLSRIELGAVSLGDGRRARPGDPHRSLRRDPDRSFHPRSPRLADGRLHAGRQRGGRRHQGTDAGRRRGGRSADRVVPDVPDEFQRSPHRFNSSRPERGPASGHATDRAPLRGCGCPRRRRDV